MKTIEQYEVEISQLSRKIAEELDIFQGNIGRIGNVIGKDSTKVFDILKRRYEEVMDRFNNVTLRNPQLLEGYLAQLSKVQAVLEEVMRAIDNIEKSGDADLIKVSLDTTTAMERANDAAEKLLTEIEAPIAEATGLEGGIIRYALVGSATYLVLRYVLKMDPWWSLAGAAVALMFFGKPSQESQTTQQTTPSA